MKWPGIWKFFTGLGTNLGLCGAGTYFMFFAPQDGTAPLDYVFRSRWVGFVMVLAWFCQTAGAWLKRYHLQQRLDALDAAAPPEPRPAPGFDPSEDDGKPAKTRRSLARVEGQIFFFMLMHPIIAGLLLAMGLKNLFPGLPSEGPRVAVFGIVVFLGAVICTVFTVRAFFPYKVPPAEDDWRRSPFVGYLADAMIIFSFQILFLTIFGLPAMMQGTKPVQPQTVLGWIATIGLFVPLLWFGLMLFFVPFRILLMVEELDTWRSRFSSLVAMAPVIMKYIVG